MPESISDLGHIAAMLTRRRVLQLPAAWCAGRMAAALPAADAVSSARGVLRRLLGDRSNDFELEWIPSEGGQQVYELSAAGGRVTAKGSSGAAISRGVYVYLRENALGMNTWSGRRLELPARLPDQTVRRTACPYHFVQYFNPCTFGYSTSFWDWPRWERELDWMALHGINAPLALEGQEAIWQTVWRSFGVTGAEWDRFTTGPAHLPWHRMGNINRFAGPLPQNWVDRKKGLQKQILRRMLDLGMTPIVPGFAGHVPEAFLRIYPHARIFTLLWGADSAAGLPRDSRTFLLHPAESDLFREAGRRFITEYKKEFQTGEYYLADPFNELRVPVTESSRYADLKQFAANILSSIRAGDPNGKWVMQGWQFANDPEFWDQNSTKAFLSGVPDDAVLILDFSGDLDGVHEIEYHDAPDSWKRLDGFYGKRWVNGMAHTFGGNNNVKGDLRLIATKPFEVLRHDSRGALSGWGINMEGIETNEVVYELMTDVGWSRRIDLDAWIAAYCRARYGAYPPAMAEAWKLLLDSAYGACIWKTKHAFQARPSLNPKPQYVETGPAFQNAVRTFLSCADQLEASPLYRNDLIELVSQAIGGRIDEHLAAACEAHKHGRSDERDRECTTAFGSLRRIDGLLHTRVDRRLETWTGSAREWAANAAEAAYYDSNARELITFWGWRELEDYASRLYSGLIRDYYLARWEVFFHQLRDGRTVSLDDWELSWLSAPYVPSTPYTVNDVIVESRALLQMTRQGISG